MLSPLKTARSQAGLTLIEIMIVLIILGVVMTWLGGRIIGAGEKNKAQITKLKIQEIGQLLEQFCLQYNSVPSGLDDLVRCTDKTGPGCIPVTREENLKDAWGRSFVYSVEGENSYRIKSLGADGKDGGEGVDFDLFGTGRCG